MFNSKSEKFFLAGLSQFYKKPASVTGDLSLTKVGFDIFDLLNIKVDFLRNELIEVNISSNPEKGVWELINLSSFS